MFWVCLVFCSYGSPYEPVTWCQNISTPVCDMTNVMTHVMSDVTSKYHAKVYAGGQCLGEVAFSPFWQSKLFWSFLSLWTRIQDFLRCIWLLFLLVSATFVAPQLSVTSNQTHLNVTVSPPMAAWNCSIESIRFWGKGFMKSSVNYAVRLTQPESLAGKVVILHFSSVVCILLVAFLFLTPHVQLNVCIFVRCLRTRLAQCLFGLWKQTCSTVVKCHIRSHIPVGPVPVKTHPSVWPSRVIQQFVLWSMCRKLVLNTLTESEHPSFNKTLFSMCYCFPLWIP